jgi:2-polyprenyl-6-methoxyphenol hydroxylase-like FAD-dependent oxidoreductase
MVPLTILIIGNGVAGPILAMALQKTTPHRIILVDAGPEDALPIGAALGIAPNGLSALKFIGAEHIVLEKGGRLEYMAVRRGDTGATLVDQPTADLFVNKFGFAVSALIAPAS